jgi:hypothetical protein
MKQNTIKNWHKAHGARQKEDCGLRIWDMRCGIWDFVLWIAERKKTNVEMF